KTALTAFEITNRVLGEALANTVAHLSPEAVVISGGLAGAGEFMFESVKGYMEANLFHVFRSKVKIIPSGLPAGDAAILGTGALIWKAVEVKS
ncbi:MAG: ROK family protein, partial [bacterium]|nr:ROK family protein [bacterium]